VGPQIPGAGIEFGNEESENERSLVLYESPSDPYPLLKVAIF
jgi:hypothetical protein